MKRKIEPSDYLKLRDKRLNALDYGELNPQYIERAFKFFMLYRPDNNTEYTEFDGRKVEKHLMIVPKRDQVESLFELNPDELHELTLILCRCDKGKPLDKESNTIVFYKSVNIRSLKKLHIHILKTNEHKQTSIS